MAKVTITFDNGPEPPITHHVLNVLAQHGINTSFYVIGRKMESEDGRAAVVRAKVQRLRAAERDAPTHSDESDRFDIVFVFLSFFVFFRFLPESAPKFRTYPYVIPYRKYTVFGQKSAFL